jgi:hypothetical protein
MPKSSPNLSPFMISLTQTMLASNMKSNAANIIFKSSTRYPQTTEFLVNYRSLQFTTSYNRESIISALEPFHYVPLVSNFLMTYKNSSPRGAGSSVELQQGEEMPLPFDSLKFVLTLVLERNVGTIHKVPYCTRQENLVR